MNLLPSKTRSSFAPDYRYWGAMEQRTGLRDSVLGRFRAKMPLLKSVCKSPCKRNHFCD